ncbi:predicted protein [Aspergillus terreus NIH2624]|uniref:Uncharacterized protein n=1 Tax=Aspergillus terreus (strain NIH 2624 / FGSC A1156) TaxID=341663 RepID=Q0C7C8_ASPTN|nr:uncharacterized protein ATEG_10406 [Aspergillus terreus NIH2624]EAU29222.1 predicted protein [Aspergillus terreus NIH2624]
MVNTHSSSSKSTLYSTISRYILLNYSLLDYSNLLFLEYMLAAFPRRENRPYKISINFKLDKYEGTIFFLILVLSDYGLILFNPLLCITFLTVIICLNIYITFKIINKNLHIYTFRMKKVFKRFFTLFFK